MSTVDPPLLDNVDDDEPLTLVPRRSLGDTELDMTPMIDMTFQLLIFFLVTFKSDPSSGVPLPPAKYGQAVPSRNAIIVSVKKGEGAGPAQIYKGFAKEPNTLITSSDLKVIEAELEEYLQTEAERADKTLVIVQAGKDVKYRDVASVAATVSRIAQIQQLYVAVMEVK